MLFSDDSQFDCTGTTVVSGYGEEQTSVLQMYVSLNVTNGVVLVSWFGEEYASSKEQRLLPLTCDPAGEMELKLYIDNILRPVPLVLKLMVVTPYTNRT